MTAMQDHIDAISTAVDDARTSIEAEVEALKAQATQPPTNTPDSPALDFAKLDAAVAKLSGDSPAPDPTPVPNTPPAPAPEPVPVAPAPAPDPNAPVDPNAPTAP